MGEVGAVRSEFRAALRQLHSGSAMEIPASLAEHMRQWCLRETEGEPVLRYEEEVAVASELSAAVERLMAAANEAFFLVLVGEPSLLTASLCCSDATVRLVEAMLNHGRPVSACALGKAGSLTFDVNDTSSASRTLGVVARGTMAHVLSSVGVDRRGVFY